MDPAWRRAVVAGLLATAATSLGPNQALAHSVPVIDPVPRSGPPLSRVAVIVSGFPAGPVEVRWNDRDGPLLATVAGEWSSTTVTIPAVGPAVYYLVAVERTADATVDVAAPFEVSAASAATSASTAPAVAGGESRGSPAGAPSGSSSAARWGILVLGTGVVLAGRAAFRRPRRRR